MTRLRIGPAVVDFAAAHRLWLLALVGVLAALYVWAERRRSPAAVRYPNVELLRSVVSPYDSWRRHAAAAVVGLALAGLVVALARPQGRVRVPKEAAVIVLVLDVSASMQAVDVQPSRLHAAITAAQQFVDELPPGIRVGLVAFDRNARVVAPPTTDHLAVRAAIGRLSLGPGTAAGEALYAALDTVDAAEVALGADASDSGSSAIVLLSDGVTTVGRPVLEAASVAAQRGVPVTTIAFGTERGVVAVQGRIIPVPADPFTMAQVAEMTSGSFFEAFSSEDLRGVYEDIGTRVGYETETRDASGVPLAGATVLLVAGLLASAVWSGRLV